MQLQNYNQNLPTKLHQNGHCGDLHDHQFTKSNDQVSALILSISFTIFDIIDHSLLLEAHFSRGFQNTTTAGFPYYHSLTSIPSYLVCWFLTFPVTS